MLHLLFIVTLLIRNQSHGWVTTVHHQTGNVTHDPTWPLNGSIHSQNKWLLVKQNSLKPSQTNWLIFNYSNSLNHYIAKTCDIFSVLGMVWFFEIKQCLFACMHVAVKHDNIMFSCVQPCRHLWMYTDQ